MQVLFILAVAIFFPIIFFAMLNDFGLKGFGQSQPPSGITVLLIVVPLSALAFLFYRWDDIAYWWRTRDIPHDPDARWPYSWSWYPKDVLQLIIFEIAWIGVLLLGPKSYVMLSGNTIPPYIIWPIIGILFGGVLLPAWTVLHPLYVVHERKANEFQKAKFGHLSFGKQRAIALVPLAAFFGIILLPLWFFPPAFAGMIIVFGVMPLAYCIIPYFAPRPEDRPVPAPLLPEPLLQIEDQSDGPVLLLPPPAPPPFVLRDELWNEIVEQSLPVPSKTAMDIILSVGDELFASAERDTRLIVAGSNYGGDVIRDMHKRVQKEILILLLAFVKRIPREDGPFEVAIASTAHAPSLIWDMMEPVRRLGMYNALSDVLRRFNANMGIITEEVHEAGRLKKRELITPQDYDGDQTRYLDGTPMRRLLDVLVPYQPFSEINRCAHHWCLGKTRRGKTTFLRHLIKYDLDAVSRGECSLVVIDSKDKGLVHEMRTLKQLEPGGALDKRVIIIDSDTPFPLNPFAMKDKGLARQVISYMVATDTSPLQAGALSFFVDAVLQTRNGNLNTLIEYIRMKEKEAPKNIGSFDKELREWWTDTRPKLYSATLSSIEQRLANFMRENRGSPIFKKLHADSWGLDLYSELHEGGKMLLVDTDLFKNGAVGAALMGRMFIALIENMASRRQKAAKPIWVVIDEASDYLTKTDPSFVQILIKAAGAKVGMTVAYQFRGLIDFAIEKALENAEIQSVCEQRGTVELTIEERPSTLSVSRLEFTEEPQMLPEKYIELRRRLAADYPYKQASEPPPTADEPLEQKL